MKQTIIILAFITACSNGSILTPEIPEPPVVSTTTEPTTTEPTTTEPTTTTVESTTPDPPEDPPPPVPTTSTTPPPPPPPPPSTSCGFLQVITSTSLDEIAGAITVTACFESLGGEMDGKLIGPYGDGLNENIYKVVTYQNNCNLKRSCIQFSSTVPHLLCANGARWRTVLRTVSPSSRLGEVREEISCP